MIGARELRIFTTVTRNYPPPPPRASEVLPPETGNAGATPSPTRARSLRRGQHYLVVVDAGHGGPDPGMTGPIGGGPRLIEKDITLAVAKLLAQELRNDGVDVLMTRTTDTLIALSDRGRIANRNKADLFVSVHVNATGSRGASAARERGFETYFLAEAKSEDAPRLRRWKTKPFGSRRERMRRREIRSASSSTTWLRTSTCANQRSCRNDQQGWERFIRAEPGVQQANFRSITRIVHAGRSGGDRIRNES
jgi:N-acetylmuramoyl-L-alanine amidase